MFIGAINATVRQFLGNVAGAFEGKAVVVGCSGNFTSEAVLGATAHPSEVHSNDVSLYSCMAGRWLTGEPLKFELADESFGWLSPHLETDTGKLATLMVLLDALPFEKQNTAHKARIWGHYKDAFPALVAQTVEKLAKVDARVTSFFAGDVLEHFKRFDGREDAVFCCYAPTYKGGYERLYKRLEQVFRWEPPSYPMMDDDSRDNLLAWMSARKFLWYDDRVIPGLTPVLRQKSGLQKTVYLYSNAVARTAVFKDKPRGPLPKMALADADTVISASSRVELVPMKTTDLAAFKDAYLGKNIDFCSGMWAFAARVDGRTVGFLEFTREKFGGTGGVYMLADLAVPHTRYKKLSKLVVMLAVAGQTRGLIERLRQARTKTIFTTAFTDRPVSMKYRGVLELVKRGEHKDGRKFLNYAGAFNGLTWKETLAEWLTRHA